MKKIKFELLTTGIEPVALPKGLWYRLSDIGKALKHHGIDYKSMGYDLRTYIEKEGGCEIYVDNVTYRLPVYYVRRKFHKKTGFISRIISLFITPWGKITSWIL